MTMVLTMMDQLLLSIGMVKNKLKYHNTRAVSQLLTTEDSRELLLKVNPLEHSDFHGVDLYLETVAFLLENWSNRNSS